MFMGASVDGGWLLLLCFTRCSVLIQRGLFSLRSSFFFLFYVAVIYITTDNLLSMLFGW